MDSVLYPLTRGTEQFHHFQHSGALPNNASFLFRELMYKRDIPYNLAMYDVTFLLYKRSSIVE
jgi:hypothetical protein